MKKEPLFIAFSTQKGGAGKTTLTVLMASYLYYVKGYDVVVVDCDFPQFSIKDMRERDLKNIERNPYLRKLAYDQFKRIGKRAYPIVGSRPDNAIETVKPFIESATPPDFIFFDLTGTVNNLGLIKTVATMDYIFCPIAADRFIMESSLKYASIINDTLITTDKSNIKGIRLLWNMVDKREKTDLYDIYDKVIAGMGLETLKTSLPDSKRFRKEGSEEGDRPFFRSTLLPPDKVLAKGSGIDALAEEILGIVKR
jgi:cellulose biosynthesis protein BcsQ